MLQGLIRGPSMYSKNRLNRGLAVDCIAQRASTKSVFLRGFTKEAVARNLLLLGIDFCLGPEVLLTVFSK